MFGTKSIVRSLAEIEDDVILAAERKGFSVFPLHQDQPLNNLYPCRDHIFVAKGIFGGRYIIGNDGRLKDEDLVWRDTLRTL